MATTRPENYSLTEASALYAKELIYARQSKRVKDYTKGLLATRGLGYYGGSLKDRDSVGANNEIILADLDPVSISAIVREAHERNGGKLGRLLPPNLNYKKLIK